jgi:hypothetical protein
VNICPEHKKNVNFEKRGFMKKFMEPFCAFQGFLSCPGYTYKNYIHERGFAT